MRNLLLTAIALLGVHLAFAQEFYPYIPAEEMPDVVQCIPAPPQDPSTDFDYDKLRYLWGKQQRKDPARLEMAVRDAIWSLDTTIVILGEHFGLKISPEETPAIYEVITRGVTTIENIRFKPKAHYFRIRPFAYFKEPSIFPQDDEWLAKEGSYPSGHTIRAWACALIMAEINPDAAEAVYTRAWESGESRVISGCHWQSDVVASRPVAGIGYAHLQTCTEYRRQMDRAQAEFNRLARNKVNVCIQGAVGRLKGVVERPAAQGILPVAIIYHGLTGYKEEAHLNAVNDSLIRAGVATVRFDFNGHGESDGEFVDMTLQNELQDALAIYEWTASQDWVDKRNIFVVGHSQGGLEAGLVAGTLGADKICGAVLLAPAACICTQAAAGVMLDARFDKDNVPEYLDWGSRHLGKEYLLGAMNLDVYGITARFTGPVLIVQGTKDLPILERDAKGYMPYLRNGKFISLEGFTHCFGEGLGIPATLSRDFILQQLR